MDAWSPRRHNSVAAFDPEIVAACRPLIVGTYRDVMFVFWRESPTADLIRQVSGHIDDFLKKIDGKCALFLVINPAVSIPKDSAVNDENVALVDRFADKIVCVSILFESTSFVQKFLRTLFGMYVARSTHAALPAESFINEREAATWLASKTSGVSDLDVIAALYALRSKAAQG